MSENSGDLSLGYMMGSSENRNGGFGGMFGEGLWAIIILAMLGFGGGWGSYGGGGAAFQGMATRADINEAFALNGLENGIRGVQSGLTDISHQISDCCCSTKQAIADSTREILGYLTNEKIESLRDENQTLRFQASQVAQNQFITQVGSDIVNRLNPPPVPAYSVPNPYTGYGWHGGYGNYGGCGCGC